MSIPESGGSQKIVVKTEPLDTLKWEGEGPATSDYLQTSWQEHSQLSESCDRHRAKKIKTEHVYDISSDTAASLTEVKTNTEDPVHKCNYLFKETKFVEDVTRNESHEKHVSHALSCCFPCKTEKSDSHKAESPDGHITDSHKTGSPDSHKTASLHRHVTEDRKPSKEELELFSNGYSRTRQRLALSEKTLPAAPAVQDVKDVSLQAKAYAHYDSGCLQVKTANNPSALNTPDVVTSLVVPLAPTTSSSEKTGGYTKKRFPDSKIMKVIVAEDGSAIVYQCKSCSKLFNKKQTLRQHFICHTDRFACAYCEARCKSKGDLLRHIQTHTKEKPYHCHVCNTDYTRESILRKHMETQRHWRACYDQENFFNLKKMTDKRDKLSPATNGSDVKLGNFPCKQCNKILYSKAEHRKHMRSHMFSLQCNVCQKRCKTAQLLQVHARSHSKASSLCCRVCSRTFPSLYSLKEHFKSHNSAKPSNRMTERKPAGSLRLGKAITKTNLKCDECDLVFLSDRQLTRHRWEHAETYVCGVCSKSFSNLTKLKIHLKLHERVVKCDVCEASFSENKELDDHVHKEHVGVGDYKCKLCYSNFQSARQLLKHIKNHSPTMLFSGKSLDECSLPPATRCKRKVSGPRDGITEVTETQISVDNERVKSVKENEAGTASDSDDNSILDSQDFYDIINNALDGSDDNLNDTDLSDSGDELYAGIKIILENEVMVSDEANEESQEPSFFHKPVIFSKADINKKHLKEFNRFSEKNKDKQNFTCKLCDVVFHEVKDLKSHLRRHVCEYCNKFFLERENLAAHKCHHMRELVKEIKTEASRLNIPKHRWKGFLMASSESEDEPEDHVQSDDVHEKHPSKPDLDGSFVHILSHDEIVQANKHVFKHYSCSDLARSIFACTICNKKYTRSTTLTRHFKTHICHFCNTFFEDKSDLLEHRHHHHKEAALRTAGTAGSDNRLHSYSLPSKANREMFKKYSFIDADRNIFRCVLCSKHFVRRTVLTCHMKTHICRYCDKFFEEKCDLVKHVTLHQVEEQTVEGDHAEYDDDEKTEFLGSSTAVGMLDQVDKTGSVLPSSHDQMSQSFQTHSPPGTSTESLQPEPMCTSSIETYQEQPSCSTSSIERAAFIENRGTKSKTTEGSGFSAGTSRQTSSFQSISQPVVLENIAEESFLVASTSCRTNKPVKIIKVIKQQRLSEPPRERDRPFECGECGRRFLKKAHLKSHLSIHTGDRPFVCYVCDKAFSRSTTLRKHMKTHMKRCARCEMSFTSKIQLDLHMKTHRT